MRARPLITSLLLLAVTTARSTSQESTRDPGREPDPLRRIYSFDADYELCIRVPHERTAAPMPLNEQATANLGALGTLGILTLGATDFASLSDAGDFFDHVDGGPETILDLIRGRAAIEGAIVPALPRLLAVRAVAAKHFKPALGVLRAASKEADLDPFLARALREAIASLNDEALAPTDPALPSLADTLARIPDSAQAILVVNHHRFPSATTLFSVGGDAGEAVFRRAIEDAGVEPREIMAEAIRYSATSRALGYLVARRFGNFQIHRSVVAMKFRETLGEQPFFQFHCEGSFDPDAAARGFAWAGLEVERDGDAVLVRSVDGHHSRIDRTTAVLWHEQFLPTTGARHPEFRASREQLEAGAAMAMWFAESTPYPEEIGVFRPRQIAVWMPTATEPTVRAESVWASNAGATAVAGATGGLGRLVENMIDGQQDLQDLAELAGELKVRREGDTVHFTLPVPDLDIPALLRRTMVWLTSFGF